MTHIGRIRQLAGLQEATRQIMDPDEEDRLDDERRAREIKIARLINLAFNKIGLPIAEDGVFYDESDREANVTLDDNRINLDLLARLKSTGLAESYDVWATTHELNIVFIVSPDLDHAVIGTSGSL